MKKFLTIMFFSNFCIGFSLKEPQPLIEAWQACQLQMNQDEQCTQLRPMVLKLRSNVELLQHNPQQMGLDIMNLQLQMQTHSNTELQNDLEEKLAVVGWLESPL